MSRILVLSTVLFAACDVGTVLSHAGGGDDAGGSGSNTGGGSDCTADAVTPNGPHTHAAGGTSNAGMGCLSAAGCHNSAMTPGGPPYSIAGTVYTSSTDKTTPKAGATIFVTVSGTTKKIISDADGNFYMDEALFAGPSNSAAGTTRASLCSATPTYATMGSSLVAGGGNCNSTSCHAPAATQGSIYLQ